MAEGILGFDLFGDPIVARQDGPGRPEHSWSLENSNKVLLAFARGLSVKEAAIAIGVTAPTLRKHYFSEVAQRVAARLRMDMTHLSRLNQQAAAGNVAAEKELIKQIERMRQRDQQQAIAPAPTKSPQLGKKDRATKEAREVRGLYEPPPAPQRLN